MDFYRLEVKHIKKQKKNYPESYYSKCPNPLYTQYCMGLYVHARKWQIECVECMKMHGTIDKHPLLKKYMPPNDCDILNTYENTSHKNNQYGNKKSNKEGCSCPSGCN